MPAFIEPRKIDTEGRQEFGPAPQHWVKVILERTVTMRRFYEACGTALHFSIEKDVPTTTMWLKVAHQEYRKLRKAALARVELLTVETLDNYFSKTVEACTDNWTDGSMSAFYELIRPSIDKGFDRIPINFRVVGEGCSLRQRWAEDSASGV